jgi:hypothetical protein
VELYRGRGKQTASKAILLIRPGAESRPESLLRLSIMDAGLLEPEVNPDIFNSAGRFLGRGDLVYRRWQLIVEYAGEHHHTDSRQYDRDILRLENLARHGWQVVRIVKRSFFGDRAGCMSRIEAALVERGWRA